MFTKEDLKAFQSEPLDQKVQRSLGKIAGWFAYWNNAVYVSFSGGIDSSVLADLCAYWCSVINATLYLLFVDTGLEYPEIRSHVKSFADWLRQKYGIEVVLDILRPKMRFDEVVKKYGYPIIGKEVSNVVRQVRAGLKNNNGSYTYRLKRIRGELLDKDGNPSAFNQQKYEPLLYVDFEISELCCNTMKKSPAKQYEKRTNRKAIIATMAEESRLRTQVWLKYGCNAFESTRAKSTPMAFWRKQDVLEYIKKYEIPIASVYGDIVYAENPDQLRFEDIGIDCGGSEALVTTGCDRTGCIFCGFGCHLDKSPSRFERLKETHPRQYEYCIGGGEYVYRSEHKHDDGTWAEFDLVNDDGEPMNETEVLEFMEFFKDNKNYRFEKVWQPNKKGLGLGHVFDELNKIYGEGFVRY